MSSSNSLCILPQRAREQIEFGKMEMLLKRVDANGFDVSLRHFILLPHLPEYKSQLQDQFFNSI